ncbi:antibiotic biosynthesis monooxygenase family protein [Peribacillus sp. SCS-37]|uniref:antibiotic biosynthesis monooxygenase family protein n=1 Tax=Paraperibacillus esterisolvens TaxID=3115296 RepID=UPI003906201E
MDSLLKTPEPPYYAVIFTSKRTEGDRGYGAMAEKMEKWASRQKGFLGLEGARDKGLGITISYWDSLEAIKNWKEDAAHRAAQEKGKSDWYEAYTIRVCRVERQSGNKKQEKLGDAGF